MFQQTRNVRCLHVDKMVEAKYESILIFLQMLTLVNQIKLILFFWFPPFSCSLLGLVLGRSTEGLQEVMVFLDPAKALKLFKPDLVRLPELRSGLISGLLDEYLNWISYSFRVC